jgi:rhodanese-related sulfurtransferase
LSTSTLGRLITPLSANTLQKRLYEGWAPLLIDVRRADELTTGVIDGALHVPVDVLEEMIKSLKERFHEPSNKDKQVGVMRDHDLSPSLDTSPSNSPSSNEECDLVVYCAQGPRAERAARALAELSPKEIEALIDLLPSHPLSAHLKRSSSFKLWELVGGWRAWAELRES